jgi:hypothetical protein
MSVALYFLEKCKKKMEENIALIQKKLADPSSILNVEVSGALVDAASGGLGGLADFATDYLEQNADVLLMQAAEANGYSKDLESIANSFNLVMNMLALGLMAKNELMMMLIKEVAKNCIKEIEKKQIILQKVKELITKLYNILLALNQGNPAWDNYIQQLRSALLLLVSAQTDLTLVRNTFSSSSFWLGKRFKDGKTKVEQAQKLMFPAESNPILNPAAKGLQNIGEGSTNTVKNGPISALGQIATGVKQLQQSGSVAMQAILPNCPIPTTAQQIQNIVAIPLISKEIIKEMQHYFGTTLLINSYLAGYKAAYDSIKLSLPDFFKKYVLGFFDKLLQRLFSLIQSMSKNLNGDPLATKGPVAGFKPDALNVTTMAFKWSMDISLVLESFKLIPESQLNDIAASQAAVLAYRNSVNRLNAMNDINVSGAVLRATAAEEQLGDLEAQVLILLLEANNAIVSCKVRKEVLGVAKAILRRLDVTIIRDVNIVSALQAFINTPLQFEDELLKIKNGVFKALKDAGLDKAADLLASGDFNKFFKLGPKEATYIGSALAALALLKNCYKTQAEKDNADKVENELKADEDLLNIKLSLDFDLAIFSNLLDCLDLTSLADLFNLQELICGLLPSENSTIGKSLAKVLDFVSF